MNEKIIAFVGATEDHLLLIGDSVAPHCSRLILVNSSPVETSLRQSMKTREIIRLITEAREDSSLVRVVKKHWRDQAHLPDFLNLPEVREVLVVTSDIKLIQDAEIVIAGKSALLQLIRPEHFRSEALVIDLNFPPVLERVRAQRDDVDFQLGGLGRFPLPLGRNEQSLIVTARELIHNFLE
jgi:predicted amino acid dehydrogenase